MTNCLHCGAETTNGLALCELCQRLAVTVFTVLPIYFGNLARWRPGRAGSRPVPGSRVLYDGDTEPRGDRIADALDAAINALTTWARSLSDDRPHFPRPLTLTDAVLSADLPDEYGDALAVNQPRIVALLCVAFEQHLTSLATLDWCGEFVRQLGEHETALRDLTETAVPGWYAGGCRRCESGTYVVPGLTWVTCRACGSTTHAADHLATILDEARGWVARPKALAEAVVALVDTEQSVPRLCDRIRQWAKRDRIAGYRSLDKDGDETGPHRYALGDVLDMVLAETRPIASDTKAS